MRITRRGWVIIGWCLAIVVVVGGAIPVIIGGAVLHHRAMAERIKPVLPLRGLDPMPILERQPARTALPEKFLL